MGAWAAMRIGASASVAVALVWGLASPGRATDVAYWQPYQSDAHAYVLCTFHGKSASDVQGFAKAGPAELLGDATLEPDGRFGGSLRVGRGGGSSGGGQGGLRVMPSAVFPGGNVAIEAWIKLERYPSSEGCVVFRRAVIDADPKYSPDADVTKGFALLIDARGGLHLETTNLFYGRTVRTSSSAGVVPLGRWVHVAGLSDGFPVSFRRLYVDGREVGAKPIEWGEGLMVGNDEERKPGAVILGNNDRQNAGLTGWIDQVRIHTRVAKYWARDDAWAPIADASPVPDGPPVFLAGHQPIAYLPLDGHTRDLAGVVSGLQVRAEGGRFVPGVRGQAWLGPLVVSAPKLLDLQEGSVEFWVQPDRVNNHADYNRNFFAGPFILYFLNNGDALDLKPFTLYFNSPAGLQFVYDDLQTEFYPGAWRHVVATWRGRSIALYIDGRPAGKLTGQSLVTKDNRGECGSVTFSPNEPIGRIDEVRLYRKALVPEEAANAMARYRQPDRLVRNVRAKPVELLAQFFPGRSTVSCRCEANVSIPGDARFRLTWTDPRGTTLVHRDVLPDAAEHRLEPAKPAELTDGEHRLSVSVVHRDGRIELGDECRFVRKHFAWENNRLGIGEEVLPPFQPIRVGEKTAAVIGREYTMNGFGLFDKAVCLGRDLLASPMRLCFLDAQGEGRWTRTGGRWLSTSPAAAVWLGGADAPGVQIRTRSTIEVDGCVRVDLQMAPGSVPTEIRKLWIEMPLRDAESPLMHAIGDGLRQNHAGRTPPGDGAVWNGSKAARAGPWRNAFVGYIWLGAEQRGLAWFGENDKGWVTEKRKSATPTHELVRRDGVLTLRVYLVNRPVTLDAARGLCFGLQASPTKPMPEGWRKRLPDVPGGLAVVPFGGLQCASQGPWRDDWRPSRRFWACHPLPPSPALPAIW